MKKNLGNDDVTKSGALNVLLKVRTMLPCSPNKDAVTIVTYGIMNSLKKSLEPRKTSKVGYEMFGEKSEFKNLNKTQYTLRKRGGGTED